MKKNMFLLSLATLTTVVLLSSCLKHNGDSNSTPSALISVLHAAPGSPSLDFYINSDKITTAPIAYADGGSLPKPSGNYSFNFVDPISGDTLVHSQDSLTGGQYYSLIVYDTTAPLKLMFIKDQFESTQDPTASYIRFLQLSPDNDPVNLYVDSVKAFANRTFADNIQDPGRSKFTTVNAGGHSYTAINAAGDTLGRLSGITLQTGGAYTIYLRGIPAESDSLGVKLDILPNF